MVSTAHTDIVRVGQCCADHAPQVVSFVLQYHVSTTRVALAHTLGFVDKPGTKLVGCYQMLDSKYSLIDA